MVTFQIYLFTLCVGAHMCKGVCARVRGWQKLAAAVCLTHILVAYQAGSLAEAVAHQVGHIGWSLSPGDVSLPSQG